MAEFDWTILLDGFFGAVCGYIASRILGGEGYGCLGNVVVGVIGSVIGVWFIKVLHITMMEGIIGRFVTAVLGAILFLSFIGVVNYLQSNKTTTKRRIRTK